MNEPSSESGKEGFLENVKDKLEEVKDKAKGAIDRLTKADTPPTATPPPTDPPLSGATQSYAPAEPTMPVGPETVAEGSSRGVPTDADPLPITDQPPQDPGGS